MIAQIAQNHGPLTWGGEPLRNPESGPRSGASASSFEKVMAEGKPALEEGSTGDSALLAVPTVKGADLARPRSLGQVQGIFTDVAEGALPQLNHANGEEVALLPTILPNQPEGSELTALPGERSDDTERFMSASDKLTDPKAKEAQAATDNVRAAAVTPSAIPETTGAAQPLAHSGASGPGSETAAPPSPVSDIVSSDSESRAMPDGGRTLLVHGRSGTTERAQMNGVGISSATDRVRESIIAASDTGHRQPSMSSLAPPSAGQSVNAAATLLSDGAVPPANSDAASPAPTPRPQPSASKPEGFRLQAGLSNAELKVATTAAAQSGSLGQAMGGPTGFTPEPPIRRRIQSRHSLPQRIRRLQMTLPGQTR